jgi:5'-3' exonuclease
MQGVGELEESILRNRREREQRAKINRKRKRDNMKEFLDLPGVYDTPTPESLEHAVGVRNEAKRIKRTLHSGVHNSEPLYPLGKDKGTVVAPESSETPEKSHIRNSGVLDSPQSSPARSDEEETPVQDELRLGEEGWKERYYNQKFNVGLNDDEFRTK